MNPTVIAHQFNDYFVDKVKPFQNPIKKDTTRINHVVNSMFLIPSTPMDILNIIKGLKNTNSEGPEEVATKIIKAVGGLICQHLSCILNLYISDGVFPDSLKLSIIKLLHKKGCKELMKNYRPIAFIPINSNIVGKIYKYKPIPRKETNYCVESKKVLDET